MLVVKLRLIGKKGQHSFRVVVQEKRSKLQGVFNDDLGWFNPHTNQVKLNQERLKYWVDNGAQLTESMAKVMKHAKNSSEVQDFAGRTKAKKKKREKMAEKNPPETPTETPAAEGAQLEVAPSVEAVENVEEPKVE